MSQQTAPPPPSGPVVPGPPPVGPPVRGRGARDRPAPALVSSSGRQRRWSLALVAVLLTLGSGLAFVALWLNAGSRQPVLAVAHDIPAGQTIARNDLVVVRISSDTDLRPLPASQQDDVVGLTANVDLLAGTLLTEAAVSAEGGIETGMAQVPVPVPIAMVPSPQPEPGDTVRLYDTGSETGGEEGPSGPQAIAEGRVSGVQERDNEVTFTLTVDEADVPAIAGAVAAENVYLLAVGSR